MAAQNCVINNKNNDVANEVQIENIKNLVNEYLGEPDGTNKYHAQLHKEVLDFLLSDNIIQRGLIDPRDPLENIKEYLMRYFRQDVFNPISSSTNINTSKAMLYQTRKLFNQVKRYQGKDIELLLRSFKFPFTIASRFDKYGTIGKMVKEFESFGDRIGAYFTKSGDAISKQSQNMYNNLSEIYNTHLVDDGSGETYLVEPLKRWANDVDEITVDGESVSVIRIIKEKENISSVELSDKRIVDIDELDGGDIEYQLKKAVINLYSTRILNDLMIGQTRRIEFVNFDSKNKRHIEEVNRHFRRRRNILKYNKEEATNYKFENTHEVRTRDKNGNEIVYEYMLIKEKEIRENDKDLDDKAGFGYGEKYYAILVGEATIKEGKYTDRKWYDGTKNRKFAPDVTKSINIFKNGFYTATSDEVFGPNFYETENKEFIERKSWNKQFSNFMYMDYQLDDILGDNLATIWDSVRLLRSEYDKIGKRIVNRYKEQSKKLNDIFSTAEKVIGKDQLETILNTYGIENNIFRDDEGNYHIAGEYVRLKGENYYPSQFDVETRDGFYLRAMDEISKKLDNADSLDEKEVKELMDSYAYFEALYNRLGEEGDKGYTVNARTVFGKHYSFYTDRMMRMKDDSIDNNYMNNIAKVMLINDATITLLDSIVKLKMTHGDNSNSMIDYAINHYKTMMNDPTASAYFGKTDVSFTRMAEILNKIPGVSGMTAKGAERISKFMNGILTSWVLGSSSAVPNRFQTISGIIEWGYDLYEEMSIERKGEAYKDWEDLLNESGVRNVIEMFNDMLFVGSGQGSITQEGGIGLAMQFPIKSMAEFAELLRYGRDGFIKALANGDSENARGLSAYITKMEFERVQKLLKKIGKRTGSQDKQRDIKYLAGLYYDLFTMKKSNSNVDDIKRIERIIKQLIPTITEDRMRAMVTWKLTAWWGGQTGKEIFTFTGSEQAVRDEIAMMAILHAEKTGILQYYLKKEQGESNAEYKRRLRTSKKAIEIARNAVYTHAFGMSKVYLPEAFRGFGSTIMQYKGYAVQETLLEWKTIQTFWRGGSRSDNIKRLIDAMRIEFSAIAPFMTDRSKITARAKRDEQALKVARLLIYRGVATFISSLIGIVPFVNGIIYRNFGFGKAVRGIESPIISFFSNILMRMLFWSVFGSDDEEDDALGMIRDTGRLLLPPTISIPLGWALSGIREITD